MRTLAHYASALVGATLVAAACAPIVGEYEVVEIESVATVVCAKDDDCELFLSCEKAPGAVSGLCTADCDRCDEDTECLNGRCFIPCELASDCPTGLQCLDLGEGSACVPADWSSGGGTCIAGAPLACSGLECVTPYDYEDTGVGVCVAGCTAGLCPAGSHCVEALGGYCLRDCTPGSCPAGMQCLLSELYPPACVPDEWVKAVGALSCYSECGIFDCPMPEGVYNGVCAEACNPDTTCAAGKVCLSSNSVSPHCFLDCSTDPLICDPLFCVAIGADTHACLPEGWQ